MIAAATFHHIRLFWILKKVLKSIVLCVVNQLGIQFEVVRCM